MTAQSGAATPHGRGVATVEHELTAPAATASALCAVDLLPAGGQDFEAASTSSGSATG